jgi:hypothetical protein
MSDSLFLSDSVKRGYFFKPFERKPTPFPQANMPEFLFSSTFFIEKVENIHYLRNSRSQYFCEVIHIQNYRYNTQRYVEETGGFEEYVQEFQQLLCFVEDETRMVGYVFEGVTEVFLQFFKTDKKHSELDKSLQSLYESARLNTLGGYDFVDKKTFEDVKVIYKYSLNPVDEFARDLLMQKYAGNPSLISNEDYITIFGVSR